MTKRFPQLVVALDVDTLAEVRTLVEKLEDQVEIFKVGSQLFTACGPAAVRFIEAKQKKVFLDLKFHDIPNTVANAVKNAVSLSVALERSLDHENRQPPKGLGLFMFTVHSAGGLEMMQAAVKANAETARQTGTSQPLVVAVTVLTSEKKKDNIQALVLERALLAQKAGCDGVVSSCEEAPMLRKEFGKDFVIVTPGIRPQGEAAQDQQRVATPRDAIRSGSDFLVVGRPIVQAADPKYAAQKMLAEMDAS